MRWPVILAILAVSATPLRADDKALEKYAAGLLQGSTLIVRNFYSNTKLEYDSDGNLLNRPETSCWERGRVRIKRVKLNQGILELQGDHVATIYDARTDSFRDFGDLGKVSIDVSFAKTAASEASVTQALSHIFLTKGDKLRDLIPKVSPTPAADKDSKEMTAPKLAIVGGKVTPPRVVYSPDPEYPRVARNADLQGTVTLWVIVGEDGRAHNIKVARALGTCSEHIELDQAAVNVLHDWKFEPAKLDGKPVPVGVNIEVNFHIN
jgi:TonB family protein